MGVADGNREALCFRARQRLRQLPADRRLIQRVVDEDIAHRIGHAHFSR